MISRQWLGLSADNQYVFCERCKSAQTTALGDEEYFRIKHSACKPYKPPRRGREDPHRQQDRTAEQEYDNIVREGLKS